MVLKERKKVHLKAGGSFKDGAFCWIEKSFLLIGMTKLIVDLHTGSQTVGLLRSCLTRSHHCNEGLVWWSEVQGRSRRVDIVRSWRCHPRRTDKQPWHRINWCFGWSHHGIPRYGMQNDSDVVNFFRVWKFLLAKQLIVLITDQFMLHSGNYWSVHTGKQWTDYSIT